MRSTINKHLPSTDTKKISTTLKRTVSVQRAFPKPSAETPGQSIAMAASPSTVLPEEDWRVEEHWALVTAYVAQMYFPTEG